MPKTIYTDPEDTLKVMNVNQPIELTPAAARQTIDDDIDKPELQIRSLKTRRNKFSPISLLPPELLLKIFILIRDWASNIRSTLPDREWWHVGHVCHHWREVALDCPALWSIPVFDIPDLAREMLQRSGSVALTIDFVSVSWTQGTLRELENAMAQIHRIQSIELTLGSGIEFETMLSSLSQPAPLLENITLHGGARSDGPLPFPLDALSDAPSLRSVSLRFLDFSWKSAVFRHRNLTSLRLSSDPATNSRATVGEMMDALFNLPNLYVLELIHSIPSHVTSHGNEKISEFKYLGRLQLSGKAVDCIFFLRHIRYPPCAEVKLRAYSKAVEEGTTILSLIGQNLRCTQNVEAGTPSSTIIQSALMSSHISGSEISFFRIADPIKHLFYPCDSLIATINLIGGFFITQLTDGLFQCICDYFDLSSLQGLFLYWHFTPNQIPTIRDFFGKLPKLTTMIICNTISTICLAIAETPEDSSGEGREEIQTPDANPLQRGKAHSSSQAPGIILPALETLVIKSVDFQQRHYLDNAKYLIDMLKKRSAIDVTRINSLRLEECRGLQAWQKRLLGEHVANLEIRDEVVDGNKLGSDHDQDEDYHSHENEGEGDDPDDD